MRGVIRVAVVAVLPRPHGSCFNIAVDDVENACNASEGSRSVPTSVVDVDLLEVFVEFRERVMKPRLEGLGGQSPLPSKDIFARAIFTIEVEKDQAVSEIANEREMMRRKTERRGVRGWTESSGGNRSRAPQSPGWGG